MNFIKILREIISGRCRFSSECKYYQKDSVSCNLEAGTHCGKYREYINI